MEMLFGMLLMAAVPGYFVLQPMALRSWRGGWHLAAVLPLVLVVPALFWSLFAFAEGSNIWPLTLIFATMLGTIYLAALWVAQRFV